MTTYVQALRDREDALRHGEGYDNHMIRGLEQVLEYIEKEVPDSDLSRRHHTLDEALRAAVAMRKRLDEWEHELEMRSITRQWLVYRYDVYDRTGGRMRSVHGKKVARYLERLADENPTLSQHLLREARCIDRVADWIAREKEKVCTSRRSEIQNAAF